MNKSVIVVGAGIAGLTAATLLAEKGFKVTVLENDSAIGGQAKSSRNPAGYPTEHSLRVYHKSYECYFSLLKRIPCLNKSVFDNLVFCELHYSTEQLDSLSIPALKNKYLNFLRFPYLVKFMLFLFNRGMRWKELKILLKLDFYNRLSEERLLSKISNVSIGQLLGLPSANEFMKNTILSSLTIAAAGKEDTCASIAIELFNDCSPFNAFQMMSGPTSECVFQHWERYLKKFQVNLLTSTQVIDFIVKDQRITHCQLSNKELLEADIVILAPSILQLGQFLNGPTLAPFFSEKQKTMPQNEWSKGFQFYLSHLPEEDREYLNPGRINAFLDSPWKIVSVVQGGNFWPGVELPSGCRFVLSVTFSEAGIAGNLHAKPLLECNEKQIVAELLLQAKLSNKSCLLGYHIPDTLQFISNEDYQRNQLTLPLHKAHQQQNGTWIINTSPFLSIISGNLEQCLGPRTNIANLYLAGQACKTTKKTPSMEKACESGFNAAIAVHQDLNSKQMIKLPFKNYNCKKNPLTRLIDSYLFKSLSSRK